VEIDDERREVFLLVLGQTCCAVTAARAASPHCTSSRGCISSFRHLRERDEDFAQAWDEALDEGRAVILAEVRRRALDGYDETVTRSDGSSVVVRKYSERLLEVLAKAYLPGFQDKVAIEGQVTQVHKVDEAALTRAVVAGARQLSEYAQKKLEERKQQLLLEGPSDA